MRYAVFGDIHGNLEALDAVLRDIERQSPEALICLGDIVGYGADPAACIARVRELGCLCLAGNHDHATTGRLDIEYFNLYAREAALWTRKILAKADRDWLDALPLLVHLDEVAFVHGSLHGPEHYHYIQSYLDAELSFEILEQSMLFCAHTHVPVTFLDTTPMSHTLEPQIDLPKDAQAIVNVGSVGQPRDEDPRACWCSYDSGRRQVTIRRVEYDVEKAGSKIRATGLPGALADRLELGK